LTAASGGRGARQGLGGGGGGGSGERGTKLRVQSKAAGFNVPELLAVRALRPIRDGGRRRERGDGCHMRHFSSMQVSPAEQWGTLLLVRAEGAKRFHPRRLDDEAAVGVTTTCACGRGRAGCAATEAKDGATDEDSETGANCR
ncbi:MAG: hypothetical protein BJ554DRAFT_53, partial [Olpidium bornovanus]